jgi:triosephosphate isomerase
LAGIHLDPENKEWPLIIAYEPVWAIGTGRAATADGANAVVADIVRPMLAECLGIEASQQIRVRMVARLKEITPENFYAARY